MASLISLFDQAFVLPLEHIAHIICEGACEIAEVLMGSWSEAPAGELLAEAAPGLVGDREEEEEGFPRATCAEGDRQQAPSAEPLSDVAAPSVPAASAPLALHPTVYQKEQRGSGAEAEGAVTGEEAGVCGVREGALDRSPSARCAEGVLPQTPSAAPLTEAAAPSPAAAPAPSAHPTRIPQQEQRGSGGAQPPSSGLTPAEGGIFSTDAFAPPSADGPLFSDPLFEFEPLSSPRTQPPQREKIVPLADCPPARHAF